MLRLQAYPKIPNLKGGDAMGMGFGWVLGDVSEPGQFGHSGVNKGFRAELTAWESGRGIVVMVNNWSFASERYLMLNIAKEYGWATGLPIFPPRSGPNADTVVLATAKVRGPKAALARYRELKDEWAAEWGKSPQLILRVTKKDWQDLVPQNMLGSSFLETTGFRGRPGSQRRVPPSTRPSRNDVAASIHNSDSIQE